MTPVSRCLHKVDHLSAVPDSSVADRLDSALNELESAYRRPSERIVALEAVLQEVCRDNQKSKTPFGRLVLSSLERRQNKIAQIS